MTIAPQHNHLSLFELNLLVKQVLEDNFMEDAWVVAEIAELKLASSGHCYLELVEKRQERIVARVKANIWNRQYYAISTDFESITGKSLAKGMKVLLRAAIGFHELYGVSLTVKSIDAGYTLGELEQQKILVRKRLVKEGLMNKNSSLSLPLLPKKIAIVSSSQAAGYEDFNSQLLNNNFQYIFETTLFEATMQGDKAPQSIVNAINQINAVHENFDCVVLIRGGGASLDLTVFDSYDVSKAVASCYLPVLCGIGHERDQSIVDSVTYLSLKTPTAVAGFLIEQFEEFENQLNVFRSEVVELVKNRIRTADQKLKTKGEKTAGIVKSFLSAQRETLLLDKLKLKHSTTVGLTKERQFLKELRGEITSSVKAFSKDNQVNLIRAKASLERSSEKYLQNKFGKFDLYSQKVNLLDPAQVLKRGYALISNKEGQIIKDKKQMDVGMSIQIRLQDGSVDAKIEKV